DKVDAEIPSPAAGVVAEIRAKEGETVPVNSVVAVISQDGEGTSPTAAAAPAKEPMADAKPAQPPTPSPQADGADTPPAKSASGVAAPAPSAGHASEAEAPKPEAHSEPAGSFEDGIRQRSSPLVRKIAKEHNVD